MWRAEMTLDYRSMIPMHSVLEAKDAEIRALQHTIAELEQENERHEQFNKKLLEDSAFLGGPVTVSEEEALQLHYTVKQFRNEIRVLREALEAVEWVPNGGINDPECAWCKQPEWAGNHAPDCQRQLALGVSDG